MSNATLVNTGNDMPRSHTAVGNLGYFSNGMEGVGTSPVHFYIEPNVVTHTTAPIFTAAVRTTQPGLQDHNQGILLNNLGNQQSVGNLKSNNNHYGINWNHPFMSNHQYNPITGQFLNQDCLPQSPGVQLLGSQGIRPVGNGGTHTHYAEAVIKGPMLEIAYFNGDDPIEWLKQCEQFYASGTPHEQ